MVLNVMGISLFLSCVVLHACRPDVEIVVEVNPTALQNQNTTTSDLLGPFSVLGFNFYEIVNPYPVANYLFAKNPQFASQAAGPELFKSAGSHPFTARRLNHMITN
jgi:hypothetical protein